MRNNSNIKKSARALIVALLLTFAAASTQSQQPTSGQTALTQSNNGLTVVSSAIKDDRYRIGPGDLLSVNVLDYPQLSADAVRVDGRGMILMPMVQDEIQASCKTEGELAKEIATRYLKYLKDPQIKVFVKEYQSQQVAVLGAVIAPGRFQLQRRVRLLELLTFVNGPDARAGRNIQIIHAGYSPGCGSVNEDEQSLETGVVTLRLAETLRGSEKANPFIEPGDIITVPDAEQYYVMGNVAKPAAYPIKDPITLTQAIVIAGGTLPDSQTDKVRILRQTEPGGPKTELVVDIKAIAKQKADEVMLQPNDIIEVRKEGGATAAVKSFLKTFLPVVTQLPMRVVY